MIGVLVGVIVILDVIVMVAMHEGLALGARLKSWGYVDSTPRDSIGIALISDVRLAARRVLGADVEPAAEVVGGIELVVELGRKVVAVLTVLKLLQVAMLETDTPTMLMRIRARDRTGVQQ
jgi:hypothetical protein